jgi:hypothetical protein
LNSRNKQNKIKKATKFYNNHNITIVWTSLDDDQNNKDKLNIIIEKK